MMHGPYASWDEAVADCCTRLHLIITFHDWKDGKLYVNAVPEIH